MVDRRIQYLTAICIALYMIFQGICLAWPSPVQPKLLGGETDVVINKAECSWMVSLITLGGVPGCMAAQFFADRWGRKTALLATTVPCALGSIIILFAKVPYLLYIARFLAGFGGGMVVVALECYVTGGHGHRIFTAEEVVTVYLTEISDKQIRGRLGTLTQTMANVGNLLMYGIGPFVSYTTLNLIVLSVPFLCLAACIWIPESPYYYLKQGKMDQAERELKKLKRMQNLKPLEAEIEAMKIQVRKDMESKTTMSELFTKKAYRKAVYIVAGLKVLQQMTGSIVIQSYLETIFKEAQTSINKETASIIYGVVQFFAGLFATLLVDKAGRKPLLIASSLGTGISTTLVGVYFFMQDYLKMEKESLAYVSSLPLIGVLGFNILYTCGIGNLPYLMQAELFPTNVKSAASSAATMAGAVLAFIVSKSYQSLVDFAGNYTVFWLFSFVSYVGVFFVYFIVPETKGKSLQDIQDTLHRNDKKKPFDNNNTPEVTPLRNPA